MPALGRSNNVHHEAPNHRPGTVGVDWGERGLHIDHDEVLARRPNRGESQALTDNSDI
jgi:hypothetical protein